MEWAEFDWLVSAALREDSARHDVTGRALIDPAREARAEIVSKAEGVICGLPLARRTAELYDCRLQFGARVHDGDRVWPGTVVAALSGPAQGLLAVERTMLNFLQRLSGIATLTARFVEKVRHTNALIYDTRKTTPGWRRLEKYAVRCGGGSNHRMSLGDAVLIKDNHLALMGIRGRTAEVLHAAIERARASCPGLVVEVEVMELSQLRAAVAAAPDVIMLDNMSPEQVREAVQMVHALAAEGARPLIEASGGITLDNVAAYAEAGADRLSVGALTHSAPALDLSMDIHA